MVPEGETAQHSVMLSKIKDLLLFFRVNLLINFFKNTFRKAEKLITCKIGGRFAHFRENFARLFPAFTLILLSIFGFLLVFKNLSFFKSLFVRPFPFDFLALSVLATLASFVRIFIVYLLCLTFAFPIAIFITSSERAHRKLTPLLQMVASIPGTAFYPLLLSMVLKYKVFIGLEVVAILVIFSTSFWYILFPVLGLMRNIPQEIKESVAALTSSRLFIARKVLIPGSFPALVTGSLAAWGGAWNALVVAEYGVFSGQTYSVFGIGALLDKANYEYGDPIKIGITLTVLILTIILLNRLVWQKLYRLAARRFAMEME